MSLPSDDDLLGWFLRWLDDEHSDCASGEDLLVALFTTAEHLDVHGATDEEYERLIAACPDPLVKNLPPDSEKAIIRACTSGCGRRLLA